MLRYTSEEQDVFVESFQLTLQHVNFMDRLSVKINYKDDVVIFHIEGTTGPNVGLTEKQMLAVFKEVKYLSKRFFGPNTEVYMG
jgi:hypothetical protein